MINALGERVSKAVSGGATTHFHYDQQGHLIAETNGATGAVIREYAWLGDIPLASIGAHMAVSDIHPDHLNTPQKMTNTSRSLVWDRQQQPFGETESITGTGSLNLRFPGQYADAENATNYNMMRNYDPTIGRYIEADPIGLDGASIANMNIYGYVGQNPLKYTDPRGLAVQPPYDPSSETLFTPGDCAYGQWAELQRRVSTLCRVKRKCSPNQDCEEIKDNIQKFNACINARIEINRTCFRGGNNVHRKSVENEERGLAECQRLQLSKNCLQCRQ